MILVEIYLNAIRQRKIITVFVNGEEVRDVYTADDATGYVLRAKCNAQGHIYAEQGEWVVTEELQGKVEIFMADVPAEGSSES